MIPDNYALSIVKKIRMEINNDIEEFIVHSVQAYSNDEKIEVNAKKIYNALQKLEHLSRFIPELEEEHNKCFKIINEFAFKGATPLEVKAFDLCGMVMQSLGAILNTLEDDE